MTHVYLDFRNIIDINNNKIMGIKSYFLDFFNKYNDKVDFIIVVKGDKDEISEYIRWIRKNISKKVNIIGKFKNILNKKNIDIHNGIGISNSLDDLLTNSYIKIYYKENSEKPMNNHNNDFLIVNNWEDVDQILSFYLSYDYKTLKRR